MSQPTPRVDLPQVPHGATAQRLTWRFLPRALRAAVEQRLGGEVVADESKESGFTTGFASVLRTADGGSVFLKAASVVAQEQVAAAYRDEITVLRALAAHDRALPMPRPLWVLDDDAWVAIGFEVVEGRPPRRPWRAVELERALDLAEEIAAATDPVPAGLALRTISEAEPSLLHAWEMLPDRPHRDEALALASSYADLPLTAFCHSDLRDDNVLLDDGSAYAVDWNHACLSTPWQDTVDLLVSAYGDGLDVEEVLARRALTRDVDPEHVDRWLAALSGFMADAALRPAPLNSPHLRTHSRWYAEATWRWLGERRRWH
ncbi:hypothetical protein GCM10011519_08590 [Marmoricola endophyticus]|uniref:Aminoglycoside phosphotransferase domain-containing protein n=1 Tax=Marmoricola endophyticus TaxID=2040280 RepID=A0A917F248_9ACTN|nr:aminoglycoside phosphotransferase family protein [Marmoricola endophyticus]GGF37348.1 hypothetical protein GCM10011519_08590 [Marmoricola endophyticus]